MSGTSRDEVTPINLAETDDFELGGVTVSPSRREMRKGAVCEVVEPKVMKVLIALAQTRPAVLSRDRLIQLCWDGRAVGEDALNRCIGALRALAKEFVPQPFAIETVARVGHRLIESGRSPASAAGLVERKTRKPWTLPAIGIAALALIALATLLLSRLERWPWQAGPQPLTVLVGPDSPDEESRALAQDVAAKLGSLQSAQPGSMRLIDQWQGSSSEPNLAFRVRRISGSRAKAGVLLTLAPHGVILWSRDFSQPSGNIADLHQQVAVTAARVIGCAIEGLESRDRLSGYDLKAYLDACALLDDAIWELPGIVQALQGVVLRSPRFAGGWAKLLSAESKLVMIFDLERSALAPKPPLEEHIAAARKVKPDLPEVYLAQYALTPRRNFAGRGFLLTEAVKHNPNHAELRSHLAAFLGSVGRMDEAVRQAREAMRLDPLSPASRDNYVSALLYSGDIDGALAQVREAERLWPRASSVIEARYRVHLRYGDPHEALRLIRSRTVDTPVTPVHESFLMARIDPSPENVENAIRHVLAKEQEVTLAIDNYAQTLAAFGRTDDLLQALLTRPPSTLVGDIIFRPAFRKIHHDPRFMRVVHRIGLIDYWRTTGEWPDFCFAADLPYDCKAEAAKLQSRLKTLAECPLSTHCGHCNSS